MAEDPILDRLLQKLLATDDPDTKAAIVAESAFAHLPATVSLGAQRCVILRWFDANIIAALLDMLPPTERPAAAQTVMVTLSTLPFIEQLAWGLTYHAQTRAGLLARTSSAVLQQAAALAVPAYRAHANPTLAGVEALYCAVASGQSDMAILLLEGLLEDVVRQEDWQAVLTLFQTIEEASALPFAVSIPHRALYHVICGLARHELGDLAGALADYDQAIALNPAEAVAYYNRGNTRRAQGDLAGALTDYDQAIALNPAEAVAYYNRGIRQGENLSTTGGQAHDLWHLVTAPPTTPEYLAYRRYLHQLDSGGQDWAVFFEAILPIAQKVAAAREFHSIMPAELERADALSEFQMRVYEKWLPDYLQGELHNEHPRPLATFLYDRFRDFLRTRKEVITNQRRLVHEQARLLSRQPHPYSTGSKPGGVDLTHSSQAVEFFIDDETRAVPYSLWPAAIASPEFAVRVQEFLARLPEPLHTVAQLLAEGRTNREVATAMGTDESTVSRQRHRIAAMWDADGEEARG